MPNRVEDKHFFKKTPATYEDGSKPVSLQKLVLGTDP